MWSRLKNLMPGAATEGDAAQESLQRGIDAFQRNDIEQAAGHFAQALQHRPQYPEAHNNLGLALRVLGRIEEAAGHFQQAVLQAPANTGAHTCLADTLMQLGRHQPAAAAYRALLALDPQNASAHCNLGLALIELGDADAAQAALRRAAALAPDDLAIAANLRMAVAGKVQRWHFSMMNDALRNAAYEGALREQVRAGMQVLEIGAGSGLLAMMAVRAGAYRVDTCEMVRPLADKARQIVADNGLGAHIHVIGKHSAALRIPDDIPRRADLLISEIVASDLLSEGILPSIEDARERLLKPDAVVIPAGAAVMGQLAGSAALEPYLRVDHACGFDLTSFNEFSPLVIEPSEFGVEMEARSDRFEVFAFDFRAQRSFPAQQVRLAVTCSAEGICQGVLQWVRLDLDANHRFENAPGSAGTGSGGHWRQTLHTFAQPVYLRAGQTVHLVAAHNRSNLMFYLERIE